MIVEHRVSDVDRLIAHLIHERVFVLVICLTIVTA